MNPINELLHSPKYVYTDLNDVENQFKLRNDILALDIQGLVDVQFKEEPKTFRVIPVFDSEESYMWYQLKYNVNAL